jgi:hypothetical protein
MAREDAQVSSPDFRQRESVKRRKSPSVTGGSVAKAAKPRKVAARRQKRATTKPTRECWLCGKRGRKYFAEHHVFTVEEVPDLTIWLCRGSHWLVNLLSRYKMIDDPKKWADLIMLARSQAKLPNKRIVVRFEEVE